MGENMENEKLAKLLEIKRVDLMIKNYEALVKFVIEKHWEQGGGDCIEIDRNTPEIFNCAISFEYLSGMNCKYIYVQKLMELEHQNLVVLKLLGKSYEGHNEYEHGQEVFSNPTQLHFLKEVVITIEKDLFQKHFYKYDKDLFDGGWDESCFRNPIEDEIIMILKKENKDSTDNCNYDCEIPDIILKKINSFEKDP